MPSIYEFWEDFIRSFHAHKNALLRSNLPSTAEPSLHAEKVSSNEVAFKNAMQLCLAAAVSQWKVVIAQPPASYPYNRNPQPIPTKTLRIIRLVDLCLLTGCTDQCEKLFRSVLDGKEDGDLRSKFQNLYNPLIAELRKLLSSRKTDISAPPFGPFFRTLIEIYLRGILGSKPIHMQSWTTRKIGCGCYECNSLDKLLESSSNMEQMFRFNQPRRLHLEQRLYAVRNLVTFQTIRTGSPHGLLVKKNAGVVAGAKWKARQDCARAFLDGIGNDKVIAKLMEGRYADVVNAVAGTNVYEVTTDAPKPRPLAPSAIVNAGQASVTSGMHPTLGLEMGASKKRDRSGLVISGPVIDLTGDDS
jgi:hypothetical protein